MRPPEPKGPGRRPFILWNPNVTNKAAITEIQHRLWYMDMGSQDSGGRPEGIRGLVPFGGRAEACSCFPNETRQRRKNPRMI